MGKRRTLFPRLGLIGGSVCLALLAAELGFRAAAPGLGVSLDSLRRARRILVTGEGEYVAHPYVPFRRARDRAWYRNSGLHEHLRGVDDPYPRILCVGGSTTEGGNAGGLRGTYPFRLAQALLRQHGIPARVLNGGVSGWTTAESLVAYLTDYQDFRPDVVLIHHAVNDVVPMRAQGFRSDYTHWRTPLRSPRAPAWKRPVLRASLLATYLEQREDALTIERLATRRDTPEAGRAPWVPFTEASDRTFRRNVGLIGELVELRGGRAVLVTLPVFVHGERDAYTDGARHNNGLLREVAAERGWPLVDLEREFEARWTEAERAAQFLDGVHLTPDGNHAKALLVADALVERGVVEAPGD